MFVDTIVLNEDTEYRTRLMNTITEQTNSACDSIQTITPASSVVQVNRAISGVVQSRDVLSRLQYAETEPIVESVIEKLSGITNDLGNRVRPTFERVLIQNQEITSLKAETVQLKYKLQSVNSAKEQVEGYLAEALLTGEQLKENRDAAKLAALQRAQEVESLSREVARLIRQSFAKGNEIADLKEQCDERQAEIERLNELLKASKRVSNGKRRSDEMDDGACSPLSARDRSSPPLPPTKRTLASRIHDHTTHVKEPDIWKMSPTVILQPGQSSKSSKHNPFYNKSKEIRPTVINISSDPPRRKLFHSDWNLDHLKEERRKSESSLPFKINSKGKPLVPVALGSRQRMSSKS
ncbi:hypothetical protein BDM02DRAFT_3186733 [Thelephora ganbajun]|uniref:Uncharacterized protein n=1 Tax=Thelephora ganbajun TaxID=370292 RepID=A0ACB6ZH37_THEGA|nr:hypothetical protein BDM02DRAFT_3186733 [Thelephora ganbajun]